MPHVSLRSLFAAGLLALLGTARLAAQPVIYTNGVVNSASYMAPGLPGAGIAQGSIFIVSGSGLGPSDPVPAPGAFPLPTDLGGTSIAISSHGVISKAVMLYASSGQLAAILPSNVATGSAKLVVNFGGQSSDAYSFEVVSSAFGIFTFNQQGFGQAVASDVNYRANTIVHTFHPGDPVILWGTGIGAITTSDAGAPPVGSFGSVKVYVGDSEATVQYHGRSGCCAGVDQVVFDVPSDVEGCAVPVGVSAGGTMSNVATIAVSKTGSTCSDSILGSDLISKLAAGQKVTFGYLRFEEGLGGDIGFATFSEYTAETAGLANYGVSSGYCMSCQSGTLACGYGLNDLSPGQVNAGPFLTVNGFGRTINMLNVGGGDYFAVLNASDGSRYLWGGRVYQMSGDGGTQIGPFSVDDTMNGTAPLISSPSQSQTVSLQGSLTLQWTGGNPNLQNGLVTIGGVSFIDTERSHYMELQCTAPLAPGQFTVPAWIIATLPKSAIMHNGNQAIPLGYVWIGEADTPTAFQAFGLSKGIITNTFYLPRNVQFK